MFCPSLYPHPPVPYFRICLCFVRRTKKDRARISRADRELVFPRPTTTTGGCSRSSCVSSEGAASARDVVRRLSSSRRVDGSLFHDEKKRGNLPWGCSAARLELPASPPPTPPECQPFFFCTIITSALGAELRGTALTIHAFAPPRQASDCGSSHTRDTHARSHIQQGRGERKQTGL